MLSKILYNAAAVTYYPDAPGRLHTMQLVRRLLALLMGGTLLLSVLTGCGLFGGGKDDDAPAPPPVPTNVPASFDWSDSGGGLEVHVTQAACGYTVTIKNTYKKDQNHWKLKVNGKDQDKNVLQPGETIVRTVNNTTVTTLIQVLATNADYSKKEATAYGGEHPDKKCG
jgi:hypothetical protein